MLKYISFFALAVLCAAIYSAVIHTRILVLRKKAEKQVKTEKMMLDSLIVEQNRIKWKEDGILAVFPVISKYLCQSTIILNNCLQLKDLKMVKATESQIAQLLSEIKTAPDELRNLVIEQYNINRTLTKLKQPVHTCIAEAKMKTIFSMAKTSLLFLEKVSNNQKQVQKKEEQLKSGLITICYEGS